MNLNNGSRKPFIYYYLIVMAIVLFLNAVVFPIFMNQEVNEVDYGTFLRMVENGEVTKVEVREEEIGFTTADETLYLTGRMDDPQLADRLLQANVEEFNEVFPEEMSPLISFLLTWIIPIGIFIALQQFLMKRMQGGPAAWAMPCLSAKAMPKYMYKLRRASPSMM